MSAYTAEVYSKLRVSTDPEADSPEFNLIAILVRQIANTPTTIEAVKKLVLEGKTPESGYGRFDALLNLFKPTDNSAELTPAFWTGFWLNKRTDQDMLNRLKRKHHCYTDTDIELWRRMAEAGNQLKQLVEQCQESYQNSFWEGYSKLFAIEAQRREDHKENGKFVFFMS